MKKIFPLLFILFLIGACSDDTLEAEVDIYCSCMQQANRGECDKRKCVELLDEINETYEFDPEAGEYIVERMKDCAKN